MFSWWYIKCLLVQPLFGASGSLCSMIVAYPGCSPISTETWTFYCNFVIAVKFLELCWFFLPSPISTKFMEHQRHTWPEHWSHCYSVCYIFSFPRLSFWCLWRRTGLLGIFINMVAVDRLYYFKSITKTYLYNFDPIKPHFYIVKLGFTGEYIIFLISAKKHRLWILVRTASARRSNEYPQSMFWTGIWKISEFLSKNFEFLW